MTTIAERTKALAKFVARADFVVSLCELLEINRDENGIIIETNGAKLDTFYDQLSQFDEEAGKAEAPVSPSAIFQGVAGE